MASYRFKDAASAAKVRSAQPETGRRAQYSRDTDKTYRNTSGEKTRAGAALREQKRLMAEPTEKSKGAKRRVMKRAMIVKAARTIKDNAEQKKQQANASVETAASQTITRSAQNAAYLGAELMRKPVRNATHALYRSVDSKIAMHRAQKTITRTARYYRSADGKVRLKMRYKSRRANKNIRSVKLKQAQKYHFRTRVGRVSAAKQQADAQARAKAKAKAQRHTQFIQEKRKGATEVYRSSGGGTSALYGHSSERIVAGRSVQQRQAAMTYGAKQRKPAPKERDRKAAQYREKARAAGIKKMKRKQAEKAIINPGNTHGAKPATTAVGRIAERMRSVAARFMQAKKTQVLLGAIAAVLAFCMIVAPAAVLASALGILFADDEAKQNDKLSTVQTAYVNAQFAWSEEVLSGESYDQVVYEGNYANDVEVLAVFAVKTTEKDGETVIEIDDKKKKILTQVYKDMNAYTKWISVVNKTRILHVQINALTADEAADKYNFTKSQRAALKELLDKYRNDLQGLLNSIFGSAAANLSPEVLALQALVEKYAKKYGISDHVGTLLAIIQVESGGVLADVMQSSESAGLPPGAIKDKEASINQGCKYYAELVKRAKQLGVDGDSIVQAYNYGGGFLDYVAKNGKKYSFELAESFAKQHSGGVRVTYKNAISTAKNGGWRYNYGNMFYVMLVQQYTGGAAYGSETFQKLMTEAKKYIGMPYVFGGSTPQTSFDCSGFICWVYTQSGVCNLPRMTAYGIYLRCTPISASQAQPGDLVFFANTYACDEPISHIGIYVGNGKMLHCGNPIGYADLSNSYWKSHMYGFARPK